MIGISFEKERPCYTIAFPHVSNDAIISLDGVQAVANDESDKPAALVACAVAATNRRFKLAR